MNEEILSWCTTKFSELAMYGNWSLRGIDILIFRLKVDLISAALLGTFSFLLCSGEECGLVINPNLRCRHKWGRKWGRWEQEEEGEGMPPVPSLSQSPLLLSLLFLPVLCLLYRLQNPDFFKPSIFRASWFFAPLVKKLGEVYPWFLEPLIF